MKKLRGFNFRAGIRPLAALEGIPDVLEDKVAGLLHLEGEGVVVKSGSDEEEALVEVEDEREVGRNTCLALQGLP